MSRVRAEEDLYPVITDLGTSRTYWPPGTVLSEYPKTWNHYVSEPHMKRHCVDELHAGPPFRTGGPFDKTEYFTNWLEPQCHTYVNYVDQYDYDGAFVPGTADLKESRMAPVDELWGDVTSFGPGGWNSFRPTKPRVNLGVALGELKDLPRMLQTTAADFKRLVKTSPWKSSDAGNTWLNYNFGWIPFINDLRDFAKLAKNLDQQLKQLERDNGHWVKRGGIVSSTAQSEVLYDLEDIWGLTPSLVTPLVKMPVEGRRRLVETITQKVWFSARFRYYLPGRSSWRWKAKAYSMLFGMIPSPSLVWELTPWSWLIDWCSNTGDVLEYFSSMLTEDLCAKYAYVMGHTLKRRDYYGSGRLYDSRVVRGNWYATYERKMRVPSSEFGFNLTSDSFSARQWSILGALGLSRLR